jgi:hypothetical protein
VQWGYVAGPLTLVPLLGALLLIPGPGGSGPRQFDRASLSLLTCHSPSGGLVTLAPEAPDAPPEPRADGLRVRIAR